MTTLITSLNLAVFLLTTFVSSPAPPTPCLAIKKLPRNAVPISANASTFKELIQNSNVFFDKTLIIDQTLLYQDKVLLLSLPSAWGKSIALDMLKDFLELELDENGCKILPHMNTKNYKLFMRGEIILPNGQVDYLESPLNIAKKRDVMKNYQGQYPVIKISFKGISCSNYQQMIDGIKSRISELFIQHSYIKNSSSNTNHNIVATDLELFQNNLDGQINSKEVTNSLAFLSELLYKRFNKNVFILVDDWDAIFCSLLLSLPIPENEVNQTISFFTDLMSNTFTNNKHLEKGILTGTFRGLKLIPDFKPVREFFTISSIFYKLCGASDEEVDKLFHYLSIDNDMRARIDDWYDGYIWRPRPKITVYNPRSIAHFVNTKRIANYRFLYNHSSSNIIRSIVMDPLSREILESFIHLGWGYLKYKQLENRFLFRPFTFAGEKALRTYLYDAGYFKIDRRLSMGIFRRIANYEVRNELCNVIMNYYQNEYKIPSARLNDAVVNFANFIANEDNTSTLLVDDLTSLVPVQRPELMHFIIHFLSSQLTLKYEYRYAELDYIFVARRNIPITDLPDDIIQNQERGIIIKVLLDGNDTINALECVKTLRHHLKKFDTIQFIKYIRIDVTPNNTIYVSAETQRVEP